MLTASGAEEAQEIMAERGRRRDPLRPAHAGHDREPNSWPIPPRSTRTRPGCCITGFADIDAVVNAVNEGKIYHYLVKPWQPQELEAVVDHAFEHNRLLRERRKLTEELARANVELEGKVKDRTRELEEKNSAAGRGRTG